MGWRAGMSLLTVLTSTIAVGAAVLGPLYLRTAGDSVLHTTVSAAPVEDSGATLAAAPGLSSSFGAVQRAEGAVERAGGLHRWYGAPLTTVISGVGLMSPHAGPVRAQLFSRTGICGVLRFRQGACDLRLGDVAISTRSARELGISVGTVLHAAVQGASAPLRLRVTGIYSVPGFNLPYWWGNAAGYFPFGHTTGTSAGIPEPQIDSLVASPATALAVPVQDAPTVEGQVPLILRNLSLGQEHALRGALAGASTAASAGGLELSTQLPSLLASADQQRHVMATIVAIAAVQLVVLAIWVLAGLLVRSSDARRPEMRVARLRGFPPQTMLAVTMIEPASLCLLGVGIGIVAAWATVALARQQLLDPAAAISPDVWVFAALGLTVVAIGVALGVSTARLLRNSRLSEGGTPAPALSSRSGFVTDAVLLVLAVVSVVALATNGNLSGHTNPIASAAPGLIALGTAVVAVQLVLFACRLGVSASAYSPRVAVFLALRQIVRRPAVMRQTRVLIIAVCLACFAVSAWSVARTNRAAAATFSVGTTEVAAVTPRAVDLEQAVHRVDPRGRFAMAAVAVITPGSTLLGVDAPRLLATASWPRGISTSSLAATSRRLDPPTAPEVNVPGAPLRLLATASATRLAPEAVRNVDVGLWVFNPQVGTTIVNLGPVHLAGWTYYASLVGECPGGCRVAGVGLIPAAKRNAPSSGTLHLSVTGLDTRSASGVWRSVAADLYPNGWRATAPGVQIGRQPRGGVTIAVLASSIAGFLGANGSSAGPMASVADHPTTLPGAVTSEVVSLNGGTAGGGTVPSQGLDGATLEIKPAVTASALPRMGGDAVMVDLDLLARSQANTTSSYATDQVWLGPHSPPDALARLRSAGLLVGGVQRSSAVFQQMQRSAPALADDFLLVATIVALLAAAASTLGTLGATTRQRAAELTALEVGGVPRRSLAGSLAVETTVLMVTALFGVAAGVLAALAAIPSLPELSKPGVIPLQYELPGGLVAATSVIVVGVVALASGAIAVMLIRRMSPALLRMAPNDTTG
jgi:putative ABC transport system permease protein